MAHRQGIHPFSGSNNNFMNREYFRIVRWPMSPGSDTGNFLQITCHSLAFHFSIQLQYLLGRITDLMYISSNDRNGKCSLRCVCTYVMKSFSVISFLSVFFFFLFVMGTQWRRVRGGIFCSTNKIENCKIIEENDY